MSELDASGEASETPLATALLPEGGGWIVAWAGPLGSACVRVERMNVERPRAVELGGGPSTHAPRLFWLGERLAALTCDAEGAWLTLLDRLVTGRLAPPQLLRAGARRVAVAAGTRSSHVFVATSDAVSAIGIDASGDIDRSGAPLIEHGSRPLLAACRAGSTSLVLASFSGEHRLHVGSPAGGARGVVRHQLASEARTLAAYGAGSRAAFAVAYSADRSVVETGIVGADARMLERRDVITRSSGADFSQVDVTWIEDDFHVLARDGARGLGTLVALGDRKVVLTFPRAPEGFACAYYRKTIAVAGAALRADDRVALQVYRSDETGASAGRSDMQIEPPLEVGRRRRMALAERCLSDAASSLGGTGYRGASIKVRSEPGESSLGLVPERARVALALRPDGASYRLTLLLAPQGESMPEEVGEGSAPARDGPFERMARWIRERLHAPVRERAEALRERASQLGAELSSSAVHVEENEGTLRLELDLAEVPSGAELARWLKGATDALRGAPSSPAVQ